MLNFIGYIFVFLLIVIIALVFKLVILYEIKSTKRFFEIEISKVEITNELKAMQKRIVGFEKELKKYPLLSVYLGQVDTILEKYSFDFNDLKIVKFSDKKYKNSDFDWNKFVEEYRMASKKIKEEVVKTSNILGHIYSWEHPLRYKYENFKKNIMLRILLKLIKILETKSENIERKNKLEQGKYQNVCRYLPAIN